MNKGLLKIVFSIVLLGGLIAAYLVAKNINENKPVEEDAETSTPKWYDLISNNKDNLAAIKVENEHGAYTLEAFGEGDNLQWKMVGQEEVVLNTDLVDTLAYGVSTFSVNSKVGDGLNPSDYGFDKPAGKAIGVYKDGSTETVIVGAATSDNIYRYIMHEGDDAVYLAYEYSAKRFFYWINDIMDKTLPSLSVGTLKYLYINQKDYQTLEFAYDGTDEEIQDALKAYGGISLSMVQPLSGRELYATSLEYYRAEGFPDIALSDLVELEPADLKKYGLDEPELEIWAIGVENENLHLLIGADAEDGYKYCMAEGKKGVFLIKAEHVTPYYNMDMFKFTDKFITLPNITIVDNMKVSAGDVSYKLVMNHDVIKAEKEGEKDTTIMYPTVNEESIDESIFKKVYAAVAGLCYDKKIDEFTVSGTPDVVINYYFNTDRPAEEIRLYNYNNDFYAVCTEGNTAEFVISKLSVKDMMSRISEFTSQ